MEARRAELRRPGRLAHHPLCRGPAGAPPPTCPGEPNDPPALSLGEGSGPRHLALHPDGHHLFVINELASTVSLLFFDPEAGVLQELQTVTTLPEGYSGKNSTAEVEVSSDGRFLYGSNRGHESIHIFAIYPKCRQLTELALPSTLR